MDMNAAYINMYSISLCCFFYLPIYIFNLNVKAHNICTLWEPHEHLGICGPRYLNTPIPRNGKHFIWKLTYFSNILIGIGIFPEIWWVVRIYDQWL